MNLMRIFLILNILISIKFIESIRVSDVCFKTESAECFGSQHSISCGDFDSICAKDRNTCETITLLKSVPKSFYSSLKRGYDSLIIQIKDCTKYKWNSDDVCLKLKNCFEATYWGIYGGSMFKPVECKCKRNYSYRCNSHFCASDHRACYELKKINKSSVKKC